MRLDILTLDYRIFLYYLRVVRKVIDRRDLHLGAEDPVNTF